MQKTPKNKQKGLTMVIRAGMVALTAILIVLFLVIMSLVSDIQGTARVVNYAGLVRGKTQRIIKLEDDGQPEDQMLADVASYIKGLRYGSDELQLVRLNDPDFQNKMTELDAYFTRLQAEVQRVRQLGYENTDIIEMSEQFFKICDAATGLAETYSQKKATRLNQLERIVIGDIVGLLLLLTIEVAKALRYAAMNRILQKKVYLDEATGLPNKNKCEEILDNDDILQQNEAVAVCVFDLNNLRTINNNLGHDKGDAYIRSFALQLKKAVPEEYFVGRDGGDEFLAVFTGLDHAGVRASLDKVRSCAAEYSKEHPEMPISYAAGYAMSTDFEDCTMRELFQHADKNMYIDKNQAKIQEAKEQREKKYELLDMVRQQGYNFTYCLYCDALLDDYQVLHADGGFFLAEDGSYTGAVEQIVQEIATEDNRKMLWEQLQPDSLNGALEEHTPLVLAYQRETEKNSRYGRMTILQVNRTADGRLHHFIVGFEKFHDLARVTANEKEQLTRYYEQMRQSVVESGNYVDALIDSAEAIYTVDLMADQIEKIFFQQKPDSEIQTKTPCSYDGYCEKFRQYISEDTLENYRIVDSSEKLLRRFRNGEKQVTVEYREQDIHGQMIWLQKTVLMSRDTVYDSRMGRERTLVHGIILYKNTSAFHEKEQKEKERLVEAAEAADSENRAKTEFMNRMSHDIRTPINGIMGMLEIIRQNRQDEAKVSECLDKIQLSTDHLLALVSDVLDINKIASGQLVLPEESFDLRALMDEVASLVNAQIEQTGLTHRRHRENIRHTALIGSPLQLRQILVNLLSNAIKYNRPGGSIDTLAKELSAADGKVWYEFKITDTGVGMSESFVKNELFKPFTQEKSDARTQYRGTGLGMSIVQGLVTKMQGTIEAESTLGEGSVFTVRLPFTIDTAETSVRKVPEESAPQQTLQGMHILLAEDNELNMEIAQFYLESAGAIVEKAWNGKEAVERFAASAEGTYPLILMDIMMPVMDGLMATKEIRRLPRKDAGTVVILAMTVQAASDSANTCKEAGMNGYLSKPLTQNQLLAQINRELQA